MYNLNVLICDDMEHVRIGHEEALTQCADKLFHPSVTEAETGEKAIALVQEALSLGSSFDLILMDIDFGQAAGLFRGMNGFQAVEKIHALMPHAVIAIVSSYGTEDNYTLVGRTRHIAKFLRRGSYHLDELKSLCKTALVRGLHHKNALLPQSKVIFTKAPVMEQYLAKIDQIDETACVFLQGESGTGKELSAERLNANARVFTGNPKRPLCAINCAGFTPQLLMSELFGHVRGSFTGADRDKTGWIEKADGGDLFLDELQNASHEFQQLLLRFLNNGTYSRVGESEFKTSKARVIVAFNVDPAEAVRSGKLREDLFARVQGNYLTIPPLRDRKGDIPALVLHFQKLAGDADKEFSEEALTFLSSLPWTTNVRGVEAVVKGALKQSKIPVITALALQEMDLVSQIMAASPLPNEGGRQDGSLRQAPRSSLEEQAEKFAQAALDSGIGMDDFLELAEKVVLRESIRRNPRVARAARGLGMHDSTLRSKLKKHSIFTA